MKQDYLKHLFTILLLLCSTVAFAHDFEVDGIYYNILSRENKMVAVTYKGTSASQYSNEYTGSVVIPESVTYNGSTYSVTSIGEDAFCYCSGLTSITIGNNVTSIGEGAFYECSSLTNVEIPNSVTSIESSVFYGCTSLTSVEIPNSVTSIGDEAFMYCTGLTSVEIPNSVTSIDNYVFYGCTGLTSVEIPNSVTSIGKGAFYNCSGLTSITIGNNVTRIGEDAFYNCSGLTSVIIPNSVTYIGSGAFYNCYKLISIEIGNSVTSIGNNAFWSCSGLTSIEIPNSVTSIGSSAFLQCTGLTSVEIPNSVTSIGSYAFMSCFGLTSVVIGNGVTRIGEGAFMYCSGLTSAVIGNGVTSIESSAFYNCSGLTSVTSLIPAEKLFAVDSYVFSGVDKNACTLYIPLGAKSTYASTAGWSEFTNIVELAPKEVSITIGQYGSATYCSPYALDFSNVEGLKAYAATGYNKATQVVTLTRVQTAEAGVGLFLKGEPGEYTVPVIEYSNDYTLNLLVGTLEETVLNSTTGEMSNYKFTIADGDEAPMFYPFEDGTTLSAGKAYLQIPTTWLPATAQKSLSVRFDDGETTDIYELKGEAGKVKIVYDLQGHVVENPTNGIYIIDGKKVLVK